MHLEEFQSSGLNTAIDARWMGSQSWPIPESHGLPLIYLAYTPSGLSHFLTHWNQARARHKNMIAVLLGDELMGREEGWVKSARECRDWIVNNPDPSISSLITIDSEASGDTVSASPSVQQSWDKQVVATKADVWLAQFYPVGGGELQVSYYSSLEWYFGWAKKHEIAMWCWLDTFSSSAQSIPSESELRLQRFTSLAYGVRGFADFLWTADGSGPSVKGAGYWDGSGKPTRIYKDLQVINREVAHVAKSLIRLTPVRTYHLDARDDGDGVRHWSDNDLDLPAWQRRTGRLANVTGAVNGNHLLVGFFRDQAGEEYFMVVNKDFARETDGAKLTTPVTLTFHPGVKSIQRLSRRTGKVEQIKVRGSYTFELPGGTGDLFKFSTGKPFAGVDRPEPPSLVETEPSSGKVCGLSGNRITLRFTGDARAVVPEIRLLDANGQPQGADMGGQFGRLFSADGKTLVLKEKGSVLANKMSFQLTLHYAHAKPLTITKLAGDVNADGQLSAEDLTAFEKEAAADRKNRADIDGDGAITRSDRELLEKLVGVRPYRWKENFDSYPTGPLAGNGGWVNAEGFPGSLLAKAWVNRTVLVSKTTSTNQSGKVAGGGTAVSMDFIGNEARFKTDGGLGEFGLIRWEFTTRAGAEGFQNNGVHLFNSQDKAGEFGSLAVEQENGQIVLRSGRGVKMAVQMRPAPIGSGHSTDPFRVSVLIDCDRRVIIWTCTNANTKDAIGPFEAPFTGMFKGIDATTVLLAGDGAQIDDIVIGNE